MENLKTIVQESKAIRAINYESDREVTLAVDSSWMAVGFILSQQGEDGKRYPSRYGSITWNETEQRYSQAKLELYGLFRALKSIKMYIVGVKNFVVEVDAKYIKGMINNPDIQPNATTNRWIARILLIDFKLRHVSAKDHALADGLSWRRFSPDDPDDEDYSEEWIDTAYGFSLECLNKTPGRYEPDRMLHETGETFSIHMNSKPRHEKNNEWDRSDQSQKSQGQAVLASEVLNIPWSEKAEHQDNDLKINQGISQEPDSSHQYSKFRP